MTDAACAGLVRRGDPWRWRAAMAAPEPGRARLMALYAFNLEVARAGYVASEPLLGEIRLRWWADAVAEICAGSVRRHEVCVPLAEAIGAAGLPQAPFDALIDARAWDCGREAFADFAALEAYLEATGAGLMWLAALALGAPAEAEGPVRDLGRATAAAAFLRAAPALRALGRRPEPLEGLAEAGLGWLARARAGRGAAPARCLPALLPSAGAGAALRRASRGRDPEPSEFRGRAAMLAVALSGRW